MTTSQFSPEVAHGRKQATQDRVHGNARTLHGQTAAISSLMFSPLMLLAFLTIIPSEMILQENLYLLASKRRKHKADN